MYAGGITDHGRIRKFAGLEWLEDYEERDFEQELRQDMGPWPGHHQEQDVLGNCRKKRIRVCSLPESVPGDEGGVRLGQVCLRTDCREKSLACARCGWNAEAQPVEGVVC